MSYKDFDLRAVTQQLGVRLFEEEGLFASVPSTAVSPHFQEILHENVPLARAINTEKARSELIIANVLVEVRKILKHHISVFSGIEFNVDKEKGLDGLCDFIISASPEQLILNSPVITVVEAKNQDIISELGHCIAEMAAAKLFNKEEGDADFSRIYGAVTTGTAWRFLKMEGWNVFIDLDEYFIEDAGKIIGILLAMAAYNA
ncbi:Type I restriction enzyme R protein N terminus (HSDR_N) [Candidatus Electronema halotolerans]